MSYQNIVLEPIEQGLYLLTINRPKVLNALNSQTLGEFRRAVTSVAEDTRARVLLITGAGEKAFVAGADIKAMQQLNPIQARALSQQAQRAFSDLEALAVPTIAMVNGFALGGGCELAMSCDWILASENAVFGQPEVSLGIIPGFGGTQRLSRLVGRAMAMEMIVTGRHVVAEEARTMGLVNHVFSAASLMDEALSMARLISSRGPVAVRLAKEAVQRGQDLDLDNACALESQAFGLCFGTTDQDEGMAAFLEKRQPEFVNQ